MNKVISKTSKKKLFCGNTQNLLIVADWKGKLTFRDSCLTLGDFYRKSAQFGREFTLDLILEL